MKFEDLDVWKRSARLSADLFKFSCNIKDYNFRDQLTRSGLSIPSNIAEGHDRGSVKEAIYFLNVAKGSCSELRTQIYIGKEIGYIEKDKGKNWIDETCLISNQLGSLIRTKRTFLNKATAQSQAAPGS